MTAAVETQAIRKRRAITEAASRLFLTKGYDSTTMEDIATLAEVSKPTVYKHFADKEQLFAAIVGATTTQVDQLVNAMIPQLATGRALEKDLEELGRRFVTALMQPHLLQLRRLVIANAERFPDVARAWYENGFERVLAALAACFKHLAADKRLQMTDPLLAANHFVGMLLWIPLNQAMFNGRRTIRSEADLKHHVAAAVRAFLHGYGGDS
jgi:TetR/AcrR family transcriptional regulator, mexJK operon transcriptional repressor